MPFFASTTGRTGALSAVLACLALALALGLGGAAPAARAATAPGTFTAPDDAAVPALIAGLRGCLSGLSASDRRVLTLRSGLGGRPPQSSAQVASTLGESAAAATAAEVVAIRRLEAQRRRAACQIRPTAARTQPAAATTKPAPASPATPAPAPATPTPAPAAPTPAPATPAPATPTATTPAASTPAGAKSSGGSSSGSTSGVFEVLIPVLLVLAFVAGISLEMNRRPRR